MLPYYILYLVILAGAGLCLTPDVQYRKALQKIFIPSLLVSLCFFAGIRSATVDRDYLNYLAWFHLIAQGSLSLFDWIKDPAFVFASVIAAGLRLEYSAVVIAFVSAALAMKFWFARETCSGQWLTLFLYLMFCRFFFGQEMTEIRAAVAIPLMSIAILWAGRGLKGRAIGAYVAALVFHLSTLAVLPIFLLLLFGVRFRSIYWILGLVPIGIAVGVMLRGLLPTLSDFSRLTPYLNGDVDSGAINFFSIYLLARVCALLTLICVFWRGLDVEERLIVFCSGLGLLIQFSLASNGNLALRLSDLFGLFDVLVLIMPLKHFKQTYASFALAYLLLLVVIGGSLFASTVNIVQPYAVAFRREGVNQDHKVFYSADALRTLDHRRRLQGLFSVPGFIKSETLSRRIRQYCLVAVYKKNPLEAPSRRQNM